MYSNNEVLQYVVIPGRSFMQVTIFISNHYNLFLQRSLHRGAGRERYMNRQRDRGVGDKYSHPSPSQLIAQYRHKYDINMDVFQITDIL